MWFIATDPGWLTNWLYDYGRMAVQVFLVVGGFLAAASLAPQGVARFKQSGRLIFQRYRRLVPPYLVAVAASVLVSAWVRPWFDHGSVPAAPTLLQVVAHALLLQDLLGYQALSAGVWYVAIDLQLFALTVLALTGAQQAQRRWPMLPVQLGMALLLLMRTASMLVFNRQDGLDSTALYFVGSYTLGMSAFWVSNGLRSGRDAAIDGSWSRTGGAGCAGHGCCGRPGAGGRVRTRCLGRCRATPGIRYAACTWVLANGCHAVRPGAGRPDGVFHFSH